MKSSFWCLSWIPGVLTKCYLDFGFKSPKSLGTAFPPALLVTVHFQRHSSCYLMSPWWSLPVHLQPSSQSWSHEGPPLPWPLPQTDCWEALSAELPLCWCSIMQIPIVSALLHSVLCLFISTSKNCSDFSAVVRHLCPSRELDDLGIYL